MNISYLNDPEKEYKTWGRTRSNRLANHDYSLDRPVHITICTQERKSIFEDIIKAEALIAELLKSSHDLEFRILCYCLMPDHIHIILSPGRSGASLSTFLNIFKGKTVALFRNKFHIDYLWQRSAFDHLIREGEDLKAIIEYIMNNPVRKGIVTTANNYQFSRCFDDEIREYL